MKKHLFLSFILAFFLFSCGTSQKTGVLQFATPLTENEKVEVLGQGQQVPDGAKLIGTFNYGDSGLTASSNCTYAALIEKATKEARALGANVVYVTKHRDPNMFSTCHAIKGNYYKK